jgi:hypothetical protein
MTHAGAVGPGLRMTTVTEAHVFTAKVISEHPARDQDDKLMLS